VALGVLGAAVALRWAKLGAGSTALLAGTTPLSDAGGCGPARPAGRGCRAFRLGCLPQVTPPPAPFEFATETAATQGYAGESAHGRPGRPPSVEHSPFTSPQLFTGQRRGKSRNSVFQARAGLGSPRRSRRRAPPPPLPRVLLVNAAAWQVDLSASCSSTHGPGVSARERDDLLEGLGARPTEALFRATSQARVGSPRAAPAAFERVNRPRLRSPAAPRAPPGFSDRKRPTPSAR